MAALVTADGRYHGDRPDMTEQEACDAIAGKINNVRFISDEEWAAIKKAKNPEERAELCAKAGKLL